MENDIDDLICKTETETQRTNVQTPRWEGGMNWEIGIDIYTVLCTKQITNEDLLITRGPY